MTTIYWNESVWYNKAMFKKSFTAVVVVSILFFNVVSAQTTSSAVDLQVLVKQLQAQIQLLQTQVADLKTEVQSLKIELKFNRVLIQGTTGDDVKQLQEFLKTFTGSYPDGLITGYYGPRTVVAVKKFQAQNGIESVGIVGPKTQEKINVLAAAIPATPAISSPGSGTQATPAISATPIPALPSATPCRTPTGVQVQSTSIKVLSPNGGEQWQIGGAYTIKYSAGKLAGNKALLIYLEKGYDAPTTKTGANSSLLIGVTTNLESYTYMVPQNIQSFPGLGSNYKITIMVEGSYSSCGAISYDGDSSDATFSIVAGQYNVPGTSAGGYGISVVPMPAAPPMVTTQDKIAGLSTQIVNLQEKLNNTTDAAARNSLTLQITALKTQMEALVEARQSQTTQNPISILYAQQNALIKQFNSTTDPATRNSLMAQITALGEKIQALTPTPTTKDQINALLEEISAYQGKLNKLNNITDAAEWDSLTARIAALKVRVQTLESNPTTPTVQPATPTLYGSTSVPAPTQGTFVLTQTTQDKINILFSQIAALQNQLNSTIDTATRDSLVVQIISLKAQVQMLQTGADTTSAIPALQDKPIATPIPETTVSTQTTPGN